MSRNFAVVSLWCLMLSLLMTQPGCTQTRAQKLADRAEKVEDSLTRERDKVLEMAPGAERSARMDHLRNLNLQLRAANISRAAAPRLLDAPDVETAYDVLEEVYGTIGWNIPLEPGDTAAKPLPSLFGPAGLDFSSFTRQRPAGGAAP